MTEPVRAPTRLRRPREQLIAALVPDAAKPLPSPAPLPTLAAPRLPAGSGSGLLIGTARIDRTGRVHERSLFRALGWGPGRRLALETVRGLIVIAPDPGGGHAVDRRGAITLPAAARRMCGIEPGPPLLLAAAVREQVLVVHPATLAAHLLAEHYRTAAGLRREN
ncbi:AbrB/MazE/SpoVT family DNA-binding domain-containing protein [Amycolatopsis panacis]|uniref:AbrB/MazE/SpoVT family DNA-binding domain-containing protein n=1 Tax=Amycolatopsis panacis TaxID=2340917 RepID=A0A419I3G8_9PSEU|nr:AbrB/MazE/SpoVT family DNA-binding domain-containing protein [Amycolatopsis panacis]RJQ84685.1 AbrB/MazE/SpoVT family DNA-binding domain-containing protein [Amycolatopsis panacis]